ncbi:MAG: autotransporter-associated beta strand repeat-containing protein, partial [Thermoguttaceae bacterium]
VEKVDSGTWTLSGANTYTGATRLYNGVLAVDTLADGGSPSGIGQSSNAAGNLVFAGGTLRYTGGDATTDRDFTNQGNAIFDVADAGTILTFSSVRGSDFGGLEGVITKTGPGTLMFHRDGGTYLTSIGAFVVEEGHFATPSNAPAQINVARLAGDGPAIVLGDGAELSLKTALQRMVAADEQVVRYTGTTATATISGEFTFSGPGGGGSNRKTFDVNDGAADVDLHVSSSFGIYSGGGGNPPAVSDLWKTGAGTMRYSGSSSHRGSTVVAEGTLALSHASSNNIAAGSGVEVHDGATLDVSGLAGSTFQLGDGQTLSGEGSIAGNIDLLSGAVLAPGMSAGTLNLDGNLTFDAGAFFDVDIEDADHADLVEMAGGTLTPGGAAIRVSLLDNFNPAIRDSWTILDGESAMAGDLFNPDVSVVQGSDFLASGKWFEVRYDNSVVLTVMPEPSAIWLAMLAAAALLLRRRRK